MRESTRRLYFVLGFSIVAAGLVGLSVLTPIIGSLTDLSIYNSGWNGASQFARDIYGTGTFQISVSVDDSSEQGPVAGHRSFVQFQLPGNASSILLVGPDKPFSQEEIRYLRTFLNQGGFLVVADDFGTANQVLAGVGAQTRVGPGPVLDLAFEKQPQFAAVFNLTEDPLTANVSSLVLNRGATLVAPPGAEALAYTTEGSWVDENADGIRQASEKEGPFAVVVREQVGQGTLIVVSDASLFTNGMREAGGNGAFVANVVDTATEGRTRVFVDESHRDYTSPLGLLGTRIKEIPVLIRLGVAAAAFGLYLLLIVNPWPTLANGARRILDRLLPGEDAPTPPTRAELLARLKAKHPGWSETTLSEVLDECGVTP